MMGLDYVIGPMPLWTFLLIVFVGALISRLVEWMGRVFWRGLMAPDDVDDVR